MFQLVFNKASIEAFNIIQDTDVGKDYTEAERNQLHC